MQATESEDCIPQLCKDVDLIYECFDATNVIQMRDYMQTMLGRSLVSHVKTPAARASAYRLLPTEALYSDSMPHLKRFAQYLKDYKE